jgi:DNA polymerase III alpha subunit (gram-positive type)
MLKVERIINSNKLGEVFKRYTGETLESARRIEQYRTKKIFAHQLNKLKDIFAEIEGFEGELTPKIIDSIVKGIKSVLIMPENL